MKLNDLEDAINIGDCSEFLKQLKIICKKNNRTFIAHRSGIARTNMYKIFNGKMEPRLSTIIKILQALHIKISFKLSPEILKKDLYDFKIMKAQQKINKYQQKLQQLKNKKE